MWWDKLLVFHYREFWSLAFVSRRAQLKLSPQEREMLSALSLSRSEPAGHVQRASRLFGYHSGETVSEIAGAWRRTGHESNGA
jgi:hypothetical protein